MGDGQGGLRYSRKRFLVLAGSFVAGLVGVVALFRRLAGGGGGGLSDSVGNMLSSFPINSVEGTQHIAAGDWSLTVDGLVDKPLHIDGAAWAAYPRVDETVDFHCVEGWTVDGVRWGGVSPKVILEQAGVKPEARYAVFHAHGGVYFSSVPLALVNDAQTLLAEHLDGEPLPAKHGGPVRLVVPAQLGYKSVKWVTRIELTATERAGYWEQRGYPEAAPIPGA